MWFSPPSEKIKGRSIGKCSPRRSPAKKNSKKFEGGLKKINLKIFSHSFHPGFSLFSKLMRVSDVHGLMAAIA
jgi:hypothetical protein